VINWNRKPVMTVLFERLRLQAHLTGLRERMGPAADQVVLDVLERYWSKTEEIREHDQEHADSQ
jgi:hypothetical protein